MRRNLAPALRLLPWDAAAVKLAPAVATSSGSSGCEESSEDEEPPCSAQAAEPAADLGTKPAQDSSLAAEDPTDLGPEKMRGLEVSAVDGRWLCSRFMHHGFCSREPGTCPGSHDLDVILDHHERLRAKKRKRAPVGSAALTSPAPRIEPLERYVRPPPPAPPHLRGKSIR